MFDKIIKDIQDNYNTLVKKCFEDCGFSEEYLTEHPNEFEVFCKPQSGFNEVKEFYHKELKDEMVTLVMLFTISVDYSSRIDFGCEDTYMIRFYPVICEEARKHRWNNEQTT